MGSSLLGVAEFGALAKLGHGLKERAGHDEPQSQWGRVIAVVQTKFSGLIEGLA
jgi:hypothetical protein